VYLIFYLVNVDSSSIESIKEKSTKPPKANFNWKKGDEKYVEKVITLIEQDYDGKFIETFLKERTGASLDEFFNDKKYLSWALGVSIPDRKSIKCRTYYLNLHLF
jgi:hypothetical protein